MYISNILIAASDAITKNFHLFILLGQIIQSNKVTPQIQFHRNSSRSTISQFMDGKKEKRKKEIHIEGTLGLT
jgi:hypothetical protein